MAINFKVIISYVQKRETTSNININMAFSGQYHWHIQLQLYSKRDISLHQLEAEDNVEVIVCQNHQITTTLGYVLVIRQD